MLRHGFFRGLLDSLLDIELLLGRFRILKLSFFLLLDLKHQLFQLFHCNFLSRLRF